jgi:2,4-diaminopentanoate dehydrogenase
MAIRVALIGTGNCGSLALKQLVNDARFDLTGVWVSSDVKVGKDAGALAGLGVTTGVAATNDLDAIIAAEPDCIVYCAMGDTRLPEAMADIRHIVLHHGYLPDEQQRRPQLRGHPRGGGPDRERHP